MLMELFQLDERKSVESLGSLLYRFSIMFLSSVPTHRAGELERTRSPLPLGLERSRVNASKTRFVLGGPEALQS